MPAPTASKRGRLSSTSTARPWRARPNAKAKPAMPPPTTRIGRSLATVAHGLGLLSSHSGFADQAPWRIGLIGCQATIVDVQGRAIGAQNLRVGPHIEKNVRMIVGRPRAHALEFLDADINLFHARIV